MTHDENFTDISSKFQLSTTEYSRIETYQPALLEALKTSSPVASAWLASWRNRAQTETEAIDQGGEIRQTIAKAAEEPQQQSLLNWCGFPTDMTRVSPFFPIVPNELKSRPFLQDELITAANWGEIRYTGPKLSVQDEDALLALLAVLDKVSQYRKEENIEGKKTYTYKGPALPLLSLIYKNKRPSKDHYKRLLFSLERLAVAGVKLSLSAGKTKSGKKREPRFTSLSSMLSNVAWDEEKKELSATVNPFFYETYFAGNITFIDVQKRMQIKGSIAKSLYRFVQSHKEKTPIWAGHFLTLAQSLNLELSQPQFELRRLIKDAISELVRQNILDKKSRLLPSDIVTIFRTGTALPSAKKKRSISR